MAVINKKKQGGLALITVLIILAGHFVEIRSVFLISEGEVI